MSNSTSIPAGSTAVTGPKTHALRREERSRRESVPLRQTTRSTTTTFEGTSPSEEASKGTKPATTEGTPNHDASHRTPLWSCIQWACQLFFTLWFRYRAIGVEHIPRRSGGLVVSNHQSFLDPLLIGLPLHRPVSFMARATLFKIPIVGTILRHTFAFPIDRLRPTPQTIRTGAERMRDGFLVGVFPEGTRSLDDCLLPFKPGFAALVKRAKQPIYPVGISGAHRALRRGTKFPRPTRVRVVFGPEIPFETIEPLLERGRESELAEVVQESVERCHTEAARLAAGRN